MCSTIPAFHYFAILEKVHFAFHFADRFITATSNVLASFWTKFFVFWCCYISLVDVGMQILYRPVINKLFKWHNIPTIFKNWTRLDRWLTDWSTKSSTQFIFINFSTLARIKIFSFLMRSIKTHCFSKHLIEISQLTRKSATISVKFSHDHYRLSYYYATICSFLLSSKEEKKSDREKEWNTLLHSRL